MAVCVTGLKPCGIAGSQRLGTVIREKDYFPAQHINKLIGLGVPMALTRPCPRGQSKEIYAKLSEVGCISQLGPLARQAGFIERGRIQSADNR
jgi:hypothetical protein